MFPLAVLLRLRSDTCTDDHRMDAIAGGRSNVSVFVRSSRRDVEVTGQFGTLHGWLKDHVYTHGAKYTANELIERVTGGPLRIAPYIQYLKTKYGELYEL